MVFPIISIGKEEIDTISLIWEYFGSHMDDYLTVLREHVVISLMALAISVILGISAGYVCVRSSRLEKWLTGTFQTLRIVPSLAILILLIPFLGTGVKPALVALVLLAIPPILLNTVTGLTEVPDFMLETASGLGMTEKQVMYRVKFPMAFPLIMTGVKTAMIEIVASAALAAKIGAGGLGGLIFTGLGLNRLDLLLVGGISVALLSLVSGAILDGIEKMMTPYLQTAPKRRIRGRRKAGRLQTEGKQRG